MIAGGEGLFCGHEVIVDLRLALGHLQHRLLVGPIGLERVETTLALQIGGKRARVEVGIDEETKVRRLANQRSPQLWIHWSGRDAAGRQSQQRQADQAAAIRKAEQHASVRHLIPTTRAGLDDGITAVRHWSCINLTWPRRGIRWPISGGNEWRPSVPC